jgi:hypothetical protein
MFASISRAWSPHMYEANTAIFPQQLVEDVASFQPRCKWFDMKGGSRCKKGHKCKNLHQPQGGATTASASAGADNLMCMHTSRVVDVAGNTDIVVRQPLPEALKAFLAAHERPVTTLGEPSHQFTVDGPNGAACVYFTLSNMRNPDAGAISAAKRKGGSGGKWKATQRGMPACIGHGTSVECGLAIIKDGHIKASKDGVVGSGTYGFEMADESMASVTEAFRRTARGGYNEGCLIVLPLDGILINKMSKKTDEVPAGCCGYSGDQFCANPGTVSFHSIVFNVHALVHELGTL